MVAENVIIIIIIIIINLTIQHLTKHDSPTTYNN